MLRECDTISNEITQKWEFLGAEKGSLGAPISDIRKTRREDGFYQRFQHGTIYLNAKSETFVLYGGVESKYNKLGYEASILGLPLSDTRNLRDGCSYCDFTGGSVYYSPLYGAQIVREPILSSWRKMGAENSMLGYPTAEARTMGNDICQRFQSGEIYWSSDIGAFELMGRIRTEWYRRGGTSGLLGRPISHMLKDDSGEYQKFEKGELIWHSRRNEVEVREY